MYVPADGNGDPEQIVYDQNGNILSTSGSGPVTGVPTGNDPTVQALRTQLGPEITDAQLRELAERVKNSGLIDGDGTQTFVLSDDSEWEVRLHARDGTLSVTGAVQLPEGTVAWNWLPRIASWVLYAGGTYPIIADNLVRHMVDYWEHLETMGIPVLDQVDATDIFAGYAALRGEPNLGEFIPPQHFPTLEAFYAAYPGLRNADVHSPLVGEILDRLRRDEAERLNRIARGPRR